MYGYQYFLTCSWSILIIIHVLNSQICGCCNARHCFASAYSYLHRRPSFATGDAWSQNDLRSTKCMGTSIFLTCSWSILITIHILNQEKCGSCNAQNSFALAHSYYLTPTGLHLKVVMHGAKMTGEAPYVWVPVFFSLVPGLY
jgi:ribosomal protein L40E